MTRVCYYVFAIYLTLSVTVVHISSVDCPNDVQFFLLSEGTSTENPNEATTNNYHEDRDESAGVTEEPNNREGSTTTMCPYSEKTCSILFLSTGHFCCSQAGRPVSTLSDTVPPSFKFPPIYGSPSASQTELQISKRTSGCFAVLQEPMCSRSSMFLYKQFKLFDDGSVHHDGSKDRLPYSDYHFHIEGDGAVRLAICSPNQMTVPKQGLGKYVVYGQAVSIVCFIVIFFIYCALPELNSMHGLVLRAYVLSATADYSLLVILSAMPEEREIGERKLCYAFAFLVHFASLASFFWLNVMCFDIWRNFRTLRPKRSDLKESQYKRFFYYCLYAWGFPLMMTSLLLIMTYAVDGPDYSKLVLKGSGCWFADWIPMLLFFGFPVTLITGCNICLFILTVLRIRKYKKNTAKHFEGDGQRHEDAKGRFNIYLTLFITMGMNWTTELISWEFRGPSSSFALDIVDMINSFEGVMLLIVLIWKDRIKQLIRKRFDGFLSNFRCAEDSGAPVVEAPMPMVPTRSTDTQ